MAYKTCNYCCGEGKITCGRCNGTGEVLGRVDYNRKFTCSKCNGTGKVDCPICYGQGTIKSDDD